MIKFYSSSRRHRLHHCCHPHHHHVSPGEDSTRIEGRSTRDEQETRTISKPIGLRSSYSVTPLKGRRTVWDPSKSVLTEILHAPCPFYPTAQNSCREFADSAQRKLSMRPMCKEEKDSPGVTHWPLLRSNPKQNRNTKASSINTRTKCIDEKKHSTHTIERL
ncbi:hypothetical protein PROFUN_16037 [Planoprotostelium fungivorum]|uniref:Uncharacterized protein n=1 Tax=Planoprotostelium fungivorum TaxID=1890364 RepID=A0A2P6MTB4_9EUKA|nr:hypothetical protein PROFUN_16037 [Planoprotostelium fungivorum]